MIFLAFLLSQCLLGVFALDDQLRMGEYVGVSVKGRLVCVHRDGKVIGLKNAVVYLDDNMKKSTETKDDGSFAIFGNRQQGMGIYNTKMEITVKLIGIVNFFNCANDNPKTMESAIILPDPIIRIDDRAAILDETDKTCAVNRRFSVPENFTVKQPKALVETRRWESFEKAMNASKTKLPVFDFGDMDIGEAIRVCINAFARIAFKNDN